MKEDEGMVDDMLAADSHVAEETIIEDPKVSSSI